MGIENEIPDADMPLMVRVRVVTGASSFARTSRAPAATVALMLSSSACAPATGLITSKEAS